MIQWQAHQAGKEMDRSGTGARQNRTQTDGHTPLNSGQGLLAGFALFAVEHGLNTACLLLRIGEFLLGRGFIEAGHRPGALLSFRSTVAFSILEAPRVRK